jgi:hypothetical protein
MKKSKSEWTSVQINKEFIQAAMRKAENDSNIPEGSIKARGLVNALLAKYAAGKLKEVK